MMTGSNGCGCICGGGFIPGPFGPGAKDDEGAQAELDRAVEEFLRRAGPSTEDTLNAWLHLREHIAIDCSVAFLLEDGKIEGSGQGEDARYRRKPLPGAPTPA